MFICRPYKTFNFKIIFLILSLYFNIDLYDFLFCVPMPNNYSCAYRRPIR